MATSCCKTTDIIIYAFAFFVTLLMKIDTAFALTQSSTIRTELSWNYGISKSAEPSEMAKLVSGGRLY